MRKAQKKRVDELIQLLNRAHIEIKKALEKNRRRLVLDLLEQSQETAIELGTIIEQSESEGCHCVSLLENYCELIFQIYEEIGKDMPVYGSSIYSMLNRAMTEIGDSIKSDITVRMEVVFLPYKVSMWDSLESIWKAADEDSGCDAYVIPIPYYDRDQDGSVREEHYEGSLYPDYVPVTDYKEYNIAERRPDVIFIHNPYDEYNRVTCVHPYFFSDHLKKYTDKLVYVPYFVVPGAIPDHFVLTPGVLHADLVFVQNQQIREQYIQILMDNTDYQSKQFLEEKIVAMGSPKTDKIIISQKNADRIPNAWKEAIGKRKVCFFNTNVNLILNNNDYFVENLNRIFSIFQKYKNDFVLLWREHPLTMETLKSMRPKLLEDYIAIKEKFLKNGWGILDETSDPHMAMAASDCYFGAGGSLVTIYSVTGKPMMVTAYRYPSGIKEEKITKEDFYNSIQWRSYYKEEYINALRLYLDNLEEICTYKEHRFGIIANRLDNLDGTVGKKIYEYTMEEKDG